MSTAKKLSIAEHFAQPPVRKGGIYCAPWCGGGCTWAAYVLATERAEALAQRLALTVGGEWKTRVHENLGWHASVLGAGGHLYVSITTGGSVIKGGDVRGYFAYISREANSLAGDWSGGAATPENAIKAARHVFDAEATRIATIERLLASAGRPR